MGMRLLALPLPLLLLAAACSKPKVVYEVDPAFPKAAYQSLALDPRKDLVIIREGLRPLDPTSPRQAALAELRDRKYQAVPATEADLWVTVFLLARGGEPRAEGPKPGGGEGGGRHGGKGGGRGGKGGQEGGAPGGGAARGLTLIVQLQDRKAGRTVWQGERVLDGREQAADGRPLSLEAALHELLQPLPEASGRP